jgi:predicted DNA-binding transcriptional regulator AlpA
MYIGISASTFDELVVAGTMPRPVKIGSRKVWDRHELDLAFDALPREDAPPTPNSWEGV